jgi:hypothetical protein
MFTCDQVKEVADEVSYLGNSTSGWNMPKTKQVAQGKAEVQQLLTGDKQERQMMGTAFKKIYMRWRES